VETVHGGRAALEQLATAPYDLVICDLVMPDVDGLAVYRAIQRAGDPHPLVLFLSGYQELPHVLDVAGAGPPAAERGPGLPLVLQERLTKAPAHESGRPAMLPEVPAWLRIQSWTAPS